MDQDHWFTRPMIFVVQIDVAGVFLADCNVCHRDSPLSSTSALTLILFRCRCIFLRYIQSSTVRICCAAEGGKVGDCCARLGNSQSQPLRSRNEAREVP